MKGLSIFPIFILALVFICDLATATESLSVEDIRRIYSEIKDMRGNFVQKTYIKDLNKTEVFKGSFVVKIPSMMRWHYGGKGEETEVIIKGKEMILYQERLRQALRQRFAPDLYGQTPVALLSGLGNIDNDFNIEERGGGLFLRPKRSMGGIVSIELRPASSEFPIGSLVITDKRSNKIEITFKNVKINTGLSDSIFEFIPPEGVELQDLDKVR